MLGGRSVGTSRTLSIVKRARVAYEPYGVVGVIGAGSAPFAQPLGQIAGALLAGNGGRLQAGRRACLAGERIARVLARAGLPEGLVRVVHGGAEVGVALAEAPVDKVLFTGSPAVGTGRRPQLRLAREGGDRRAGRQGRDARARRRAPAAGGGRSAVGRLRRRRAGTRLGRARLRRARGPRAFVAALVEGAGELRVGDPADARTQLGPLASRARLEHVRELVEEAVAEGGAAALRRPRRARRSERGAF